MMARAKGMEMRMRVVIQFVGMDVRVVVFVRPIAVPALASAVAPMGVRMDVGVLVHEV